MNSELEVKVMKEQIMKALMCCLNPERGCEGCPYIEDDCENDLHRDILDVLIELEQDNVALTKELDAARQAINRMISKLGAAELYRN